MQRFCCCYAKAGETIHYHDDERSPVSDISLSLWVKGASKHPKHSCSPYHRLQTNPPPCSKQEVLVSRSQSPADVYREPNRYYSVVSVRITILALILFFSLDWFNLLVYSRQYNIKWHRFIKLNSETNTWFHLSAMKNEWKCKLKIKMKITVNTYNHMDNHMEIDAYNTHSGHILFISDY